MDSYTLKADVYLTDLQAVELAGFSVQMIETPGHTAGSCCYYLKDEGVSAEILSSVVLGGEEQTFQREVRQQL